MKPMVAITQRVEILADRGERRDALDQRWIDFMSACGLMAYPVANRPDFARGAMEKIDPAGLVLTGGNDLANYGGDAPERDATERLLIEWMRERRRPIVAVCRGVQMLTEFFGGDLVRLDGHAGARHKIVLDAGAVRDVNSFHNWGLAAVPEGFSSWAATESGSVEAIRHHGEDIVGVLWHPEREAPFHGDDITLFRQAFGVGT